jgi:hypothetical protein
MRLWVGISIWTTVLACVTTGITIGILVSAWKQNVDALWSTASLATLTQVSAQINAHLDAVAFAAVRVPLDSTQLLGYYVGYAQHSPFHMDSLGFLSRGAAGNSKYSWQMAEFYVCPQWGYFYSDASINPQFHGYCANDTVIDYGSLAYNGSDWGLKPQEIQLLDGTLEETFLPVGSIVGIPTLTYEVARDTNGPPAGGPFVSFADIDLATFVTFLRSDVTVWNGYGLVTVHDTNTGAIIASNGPDVGIDTSQWYTAAFRTQRPGLDWTTTVAVQNIYDNMQWRIGVACGIAAGVAIIFIVLNYIIVYLWVTKFLSAKQRGEQSFTPISDFKDFE